MTEIPQRVSESVFPPEKHSALMTFVVLKRIFSHLSNGKLLEIRQVDRLFNFVAVSELNSRNFVPPPMTVSSHRSKQPATNSNQDYEGLIKFENSRQKIWMELYGENCPMIKIRNLHIHLRHLEKTEGFRNFLRVPWLAFVTDLTLCLYESCCYEILTTWILPSFSSLKSLACIVQPSPIASYDENNVRSVTDDTNSIQTSFEKLDCKEVGQLKYVTVVTLTITMEEPCGFPISLLHIFQKMKNLSLKFGNSAALIRCAKDVAFDGHSPQIQNFSIEIVHRTEIESQVQEHGLQTQAFASANAKLCNTFCPTKLCQIASMIPAVVISFFFEALNAVPATVLELEVGAPLNLRYTSAKNDFLRILFSAIGAKFPYVAALELDYLQHYGDIDYLGSVSLSQVPNSIQHLKYLQLCTVLAEPEDFPKLKWSSVYEYYSIVPELVELNELILDIASSSDLVAFIDALRKHKTRVRKLVFRAAPHFCQPGRELSAWCWFPCSSSKDGPKNWCYGCNPGTAYYGIPGVQVEEEISKMPTLTLKRIELDPEWNKVVPTSSTAWALLCAERDKVKDENCDQTSEVFESKMWPSAIDCVKITTS